MEYKCIVCNIELPNNLFNECYKCFNRYFEASIFIERMNTEKDKNGHYRINKNI